MSVKITRANRNARLVTPSQMEDGDIGVVVQWPNKSYLIGQLFQKYEGKYYGGQNTFLRVGYRAGCSFSTTANDGFVVIDKGFEAYDHVLLELVTEITFSTQPIDS